MLHIHCLGKLKTQLNDLTLYQPTNTKNKKKFLLLAYLWEQKKPQTRKHLAQLLWPDSDSASGNRSLNTLIFRLRKDGLDDYIRSNKQTIQFTNQVSPIESDLDQFRQILDRLTPDLPLEQLETPFKLFQGPFLADFDFSDLPGIADWAYAIQHEIESKLLISYRLLAPRLIEAGMPDKGSEYGRILTTYVREDEATWVWLVRCLAGQGDVAQALQVLSQYRQDALAKNPAHRFSASLIELGGQLSDPSQVVELMEQGQELNLHSKFARPFESNVTQYITPLSEVIGRESDRSLLLDLIKKNHRLISVVGLGGVGKTTLLRSLIPELLQHFRHRVIFVELHPSRPADDSLPETEQFVEALGKAFDISGTDADTITEGIVSQIGDQPACLILDNFESVKNGALIVGKLVDQLSGLTVLTTSRVRLNLRREVAYQLSGLPLMEESDNYQQAGPAQRLFERAAQRQHPTFKLTAENNATVSELCRHLDGLPLAIELVTQQLNHYSIRELITRSQESGRFLQSDIIDIREEHRSIHQLLQTMWQTLSERAQEVLPELTRFANEWSMKAMEAIVPAERAIYNELLSTSMLQQVGPGQFKLHPLIKQFAAGQKAPAEDSLLSFSLERDATDIRQLAQRYETGLTHTPEEDDELRFELLTGVVRSKLVLQQDLLYLPEVIERLIAIAKRLDDRQKLIQAQILMSRCYGRTSQYNQAIEILEQGLELTKDKPDHLKERAIMLFYISEEMMEVNRIKEAVNHAAQCRSLMEQINIPGLQIKLEYVECHLKFEMGDFKTALELTLQFVETCRQNNYLAELCNGLNHLAVIYTSLIQPEKLLQTLEEMIQVAQQIQYSHLEYLARLNLGAVQTEFGQFDEAIINSTIAQQGFKNSHNVHYWSSSILPLAIVYFETGQYELAETMFLESINVLANTDEAWRYVITHWHYGIYLMKMKRFEEAEQELIRAEGYLSEEMRPSARLSINCAKYWIWCQTGRKAEAREKLEELYAGVNQFDSRNGWPLTTRPVLQCFYVLDSLDDPRADDLLKRTYVSICKVAELFSSQKRKEAFLMNPRPHRKVFELYEQKLGTQISAKAYKSPLV